MCPEEPPVYADYESDPPKSYSGGKVRKSKAINKKQEGPEYFGVEMNYDAREFSYQTDAYECKEWFDHVNKDEPTRKTKEWLSENGHPRTKAALCSAKVPKFNLNDEYTFMYDMNFSDDLVKQFCQVTCDYCPGETELNNRNEKYVTTPRVEATPTAKINKGFFNFISYIITSGKRLFLLDTQQFCLSNF